MRGEPGGERSERGGERRVHAGEPGSARSERGGPMRALAVVSALAVCLACGTEPASTPAPAETALEIDRAEVDAQVHEVFAAIARADCDTLARRVPAIRSEDECREFVRRSEEMEVRLVEVREVVRDGRDPSAAIVRAVVERGGRPRRVQIRAVRSEGQWTFVL